MTHVYIGSGGVNKEVREAITERQRERHREGYVTSSAEKTRCSQQLLHIVSLIFSLI